MSDDNGFLARWSRRKRDNAPDTNQQLKAQNDGSTVTSEGAVSFSPDDANPSFDPTRLPPIDTIGAGSDIRAFLAAGVPADLKRAALRRVWLSDPKIRDFVGLSENSWDFNAPGTIAGFGPIKQEDVGRLLAQLLGKPDVPPVTAHSSTELSQADKAEASGSESHHVDEIQPDLRSTDEPVSDQRLNSANTTDYAIPRLKAPPASQLASSPSARGPRRAHGGALPK
jgi:hypothetical protein